MQSTPPSSPPAKGAAIAFFDVETTIPSRVGQGYALLEFGAILVCPRRLVELGSYSTLICPRDLSAISASSVRCNGITRESVASAPGFEQVADRVYDMLHGASVELGVVKMLQTNLRNGVRGFLGSNPAFSLDA